MQVRPLRKATQLSIRNAFIIMTVMILFIVWLALARAPFSQYSRPSENLELSVIGNGRTIWAVESFSFMLSVLILQTGILVLVLCIADVGGGTLAPP